MHDRRWTKVAVPISEKPQKDVFLYVLEDVVNCGHAILRGRCGSL